MAAVYSFQFKKQNVIFSGHILKIRLLVFICNDG